VNSVSAVFGHKCESDILSFRSTDLGSASVIWKTLFQTQMRLLEDRSMLYLLHYSEFH